MSLKKDQGQAAFLQAIDDVVANYGLLKHPFYQAWSKGELDLDTIREYAQQYFAHVSQFPRYVSAVHSRCEDLETRQELLDNLIEEERGPDNHPELWLRFAEGLGSSRESTLDATKLPETQQSVDTMMQLCCSDDYRHGVAALYAYESQVPDVALSKREGLKSFYGIDDPEVVKYFAVHEEADVLHREGERRILAEQCRTVEQRQSAIDAAESAAKAMWTFLDGVQRAYVSGTTASA